MKQAIATALEMAVQNQIGELFSVLVSNLIPVGGKTVNSQQETDALEKYNKGVGTVKRAYALASGGGELL